MKKLAYSECEFCRSNQSYNSINQGMNMKVSRNRLLLHSCCGPCSTAVIERLLETYDITVYFYNPNITEKKEYDLRFEAQKQVVDRFNDGSRFIIEKIGLIQGPYEPDEFMRRVRGREKEPEGGSRCGLCFDMRLEETARFARCNGYDAFTTTLSVSPHKNYQMISEKGKALALKYGVEFLDLDFKKKAGFQRSIELSKEMGLYRQNYCGCEFSKWFDK